MDKHTDTVNPIQPGSPKEFRVTDREPCLQTAPLHGTRSHVFWVQEIQGQFYSVRKHPLKFSFSWKIYLKMQFFYYGSSRGAVAGTAAAEAECCCASTSPYRELSGGLIQMIFYKALFFYFYCFSRLTLVCYFCDTTLFSNL